MKKNIYKIFYVLFLAFIFTFSFSLKSYAAYPKLISTMIGAFEDIKEWLIAVATPAVAVAVRHWCFYEKI